MSGVSVIWYLLSHNATLLAQVPASRIQAGVLPLDTDLPAISVTQISSVPMNLLRINETPRLHTDRIQVTALGTGYPGIKSLMKLILAACPSQRGTVNGIAVDSIIPEAEGPDLHDMETSVHACSRDFIVRYSA